MRHFLTGLLVAAAVAAVSTPALADNQQVATRIAKNLQNDGLLKDFKIGVKYQDGVAWLRGRVRTEEQMNSALRTVFKTPGVGRVVNELTLGSTVASGSLQTVGPATSMYHSGRTPARTGPATVERLEAVIAAGRQQPVSQARAELAAGRNLKRAERVDSSFSQGVGQTVATAHRQMKPKVSLAPPRVARARIPGRPIPVAYTQPAGAMQEARPVGGPIPAYVSAAGGGVASARYDQPQLPNYAWPSYAPYPNYAALTYPKQYSPTAWPFIGPFYPYPQVPLGWRKVTLEWDDGWWMLDFKE